MQFAKYFSVIAATMIKFAGGPITGVVLQLSWVETALCSVIGMMLTVLLVMFLGEFLGRVKGYFIKNKPQKKFSRITRIAIKIRKKFGLTGIAFVTPLILTPAGGTIIALAFNYTKVRILGAMLIWAVFWGIVQSLFFFYLRHFIGS